MNASSAVGEIGKSSAHEDFSVVRPAAGGNEQVDALVRHCLQLHIGSGAPVTSFLFFHGPDPWLCRAEREVGSDASGRPKSRVRFVKAGANTTPALRVALLEKTHRSPLDDAEAALGVESSDIPDPEATGTARLALIALLLGGDVPVVSTAAEAAWTASAWGECAPLALMRTDGRAPYQSPLPDLLAVGPHSWLAVAAVREIHQRIGQRAIPDVSLLRQVADTALRAMLLRLWAEGTDAPPPEVPDDAATWLLAAGVGRATLVARASGHLRRRWLHQRLLTAAEVEASRMEWTTTDHPFVGVALSNQPDGIRRFIECVNPDPDAIGGVLPTALADAFTWIRAGGDGPPPPGASTAVEALARAGALDRLQLKGLDAAVAHSDNERLRDAWVRALAREVRDGCLAPARALEQLSRRLHETRGVDRDRVRAVLAACGVADPGEWAEVIGDAGSLRTMTPTPARADSLATLARAGLVPLSRVVREVLEGSSVGWLERLVPRAAFALVASEAAPPSSPPHDWDPALDELLSRCAVEPAFWARWAGPGVPLAVVDWLATRLAAYQGGALAQQVAAALRGSGVLRIGALRVVAAGLPPDVCLSQAVRWAAVTTGQEPREALRILAGATKSPAIEWLRHRIGTWEHAAWPANGATAHELEALLPWLDPVRLVQFVMSRPVVDAEEDRLLDAVAWRLQTGEHRPLPAPPAAVAARRPEWVRRLATIPGWEGWAEPLEAPGDKGGNRES